MRLKNEESLKWNKELHMEEMDSVTHDKRQKLMHSNIWRKYAVCALGKSISKRKSSKKKIIYFLLNTEDWT